MDCPKKPSLLIFRELCYNSSEERREAAMEKTLYVSDLDGTLLTPEQRLSPFTVRVLEKRRWG